MYLLAILYFVISLKNIYHYSYNLSQTGNILVLPKLRLKVYGVEKTQPRKNLYYCDMSDGESKSYII